MAWPRIGTRSTNSRSELGLAVDEKAYLDDNALHELEQNGLVPVRLIPDEAYLLAVRKQLQILNAIDQFEDSKRKIRVAANRLKADLNLFANASLDSERPTDYTKFDPDQIRAGVGIELDLPLDRLRERNTYRATLVLSPNCGPDAHADNQWTASSGLHA
jgi:hypothetical protein